MEQNLSRRLYVENVTDFERNLSQKRFSDRKPEVKVIERGIVLPARLVNGTWEGGVHDKDFNFVAGYLRAIPPNKANQFSKWAVMESGYKVDRDKLVQLDEDVIFGGALIGHFGHFIMECWCRLWYVIQNPESKSKILFVLLNAGHKSWFDDFFRLMGIDKERIVYVKEPTQCRSVLVPDQSQYSANEFTNEYLIPYQAIKSRVTPGKTKKLYLTRTIFDEDYLTWTHADKKNYPSRGVLFNEKYFEDRFCEWGGVNKISPETLSIEEQISLIMGAEEIVCTLGTLSNWAIFCKPDTELILLGRVHDVGTLGFQFLVHEAQKFSNCYYIDVSRDFMYKVHANSACVIGSTKYWKEFVADYFGKQIEEDDDAPYLAETLDKYVDFWYKKYSGQEEKIVSSLKSMCRQIVTLESAVCHKRPLVKYQTHVSAKGWGDGWKIECQLSNPLDQQRDIQAIKIDFPNHKIYYAVYFNDKEGWSKEVAAPEQAGTTGKSKAITGIKIRLDEAGAKEFNILYRVHKFDGAWTDWAKNGEAIYSHGQKLNAVQIKLETKT